MPVSETEEATPVSDRPTYKSVLSGAAAAPQLAPALDIIPMSPQEMSKDILKSLFRFPTDGEKFRSHINVEYTASMETVKYQFKYEFKGGRK